MSSTATTSYFSIQEVHLQVWSTEKYLENTMQSGKLHIEIIYFWARELYPHSLATVCIFYYFGSIIALSLPPSILITINYFIAVIIMLIFLQDLNFVLFFCDSFNVYCRILNACYRPLSFVLNSWWVFVKYLCTPSRKYKIEVKLFMITMKRGLLCRKHTVRQCTLMNLTCSLLFFLSRFNRNDKKLFYSFMII